MKELKFYIYLITITLLIIGVVKFVISSFRDYKSGEMYRKDREGTELSKSIQKIYGVIGNLFLFVLFLAGPALLVREVIYFLKHGSINTLKLSSIGDFTPVHSKWVGADMIINHIVSFISNIPLLVYSILFSVIAFYAMLDNSKK